MYHGTRHETHHKIHHKTHHETRHTARTKLFNVQASGVGQMSLSVGDKVIVTNKDKEEWWYVWKDAKQVRWTLGRDRGIVSAEMQSDHVLLHWFHISVATCHYKSTEYCSTYSGLFWSEKLIRSRYMIHTTHCFTLSCFSVSFLFAGLVPRRVSPGRKRGKTTRKLQSHFGLQSCRCTRTVCQKRTGNIYTLLWWLLSSSYFC